MLRRLHEPRERAAAGAALARRAEASGLDLVTFQDHPRCRGAHYFQIRPTGGAVADVADDTTAYAHRHAECSAVAFGGDPERLDSGGVFSDSFAIPPEEAVTG